MKILKSSSTLDEWTRQGDEFGARLAGLCSWRGMGVGERFEACRHAWGREALEPGVQWARVAGAAKQGGHALESMAIFLHQKQGYAQWRIEARAASSNDSMQDMQAMQAAGDQEAKTSCREVLAACALAAAAQGRTITVRAGAYIEACLGMEAAEGALVDTSSERVQGALDAMEARSEELFELFGEGWTASSQGALTGLVGLRGLSSALAAARLSRELASELPPVERKGRGMAL